MTDYFVGPGGNDGNDGLSWVNRFLTLNAAEDVPVVAGDNVFVGPGVYREQLTVDVSGGAGNVITYIGDVTGENTDSVGGIVRITGSDDDTTATRDASIKDAFATRSFRTFRGFLCDLTADRGIQFAGGGTDITIEDCVVMHNTGGHGIQGAGAGQANFIIRRCMVWDTRSFFGNIEFEHGSEVDDAGHVIENCILMGNRNAHGVQSKRVGGITVRDCFMLNGSAGVFVEDALTVGQTIIVNNCIIQGNNEGLSATVAGEIVENFNALFNNQTARTNTDIGANSNAFPSLLVPPILLDGFKFPWWFGELSEWSQIQAIVGTGEPSDDLLGITRPVTAAKNSWGPLQFVDKERDTGTVRTGTASIVFHDAGRHQIFVPITNSSTTISVFVNREADYAGTNPQLVIKQPGQADDTTVDIGAAGAWNKLTTTLTPAANPPYVIAELVSNNTAVAGSFAAYFDDLTVD